MNKLFSILALSAGIVGMSSCSDFLDQDSPSEQTQAKVYESPYYTNLAVNKIYGGLAEDRTYAQDFSITVGLNSDCELVDGLGSNAYTTSNDRGVCNYNADANWSRMDERWTKLYGVIENANLVIEGVRGSSLYQNGSNSEKTEMGRYLGEALTLRAMLYFDMVRTWGDVPLKLESSQSNLSNAYAGKTDRDVIMDTLMVNLEEAIELLPWADEATDYTTERATKGYAHGLLAQIAMTRAGYAIREAAKDGYETASYTDATYPTQRPGASERQALYEKALKHWSAIISSGKHQLNPSFENEWYLINQLTLDQTYHENIFEIPMGENVTGELGYTVGVRLSAETSTYGYTNSSGKMKTTAPLLYSFDPNDTRRDVTCAAFQIEAQTAKGQAVETMLGNAPFGIYIGKWDPRKMNDTWLANNKAATAKHTTGINPVKLRYSQVLLYYAECMNELAGPDGNYSGDAGLTARQALALVHTRAFDDANKSAAQAYVNAIAADKESFFNALVDENAWELTGESARKYDLIRWNLLASKIVEFKNTYLQELADGVYQEKIYFNYTDETKTKIDMSSVTWYGLPAGKTAADYDDSKDSFGKEKLDGTGTQIGTNLPSISSGLVGDDVTVKNRYLLPIGNSTISASNHYLENSYGY